MRLPDRLAAALVDIRPDRPDAIVALSTFYDEALHFRDPIQELDGLPAFLAMNRHLVGRMRSLHWTIRGVTGDDAYAVLEWSVHGTTKFRLPLAVDGTTVVRARNGRIHDHRDYWDLGEMFASPLPFGQRLLYLLRRPLA
jgi:steroid Delta-isomerase